MTVLKLVTHQRFGEVVSYHFLSWTVFNLKFVVLDKISHIEILEIEMSCMLAAAVLAILFQFHGTGVVAIDDAGFNRIALLFDKKFGPENLRDSIIEAIYSDSVEL
jgi:hypothetical protein